MPGYQPRIAIVGGGPAGLALSLMLSKQEIQTTIYELRNKPTPEELAKPSGMLDLHEESGLEVMRQCDLYDAFQAALGDCTESMQILNPSGTILHKDEGGPEQRPEIPRNVLTSLISHGIPTGTIRWNHKVTHVHSIQNPVTHAAEYTLTFASGDSATYDFIIGADGAWSRVRKLLSDVEPIYTGVHFITAHVRNVSTNYPLLAALSGTGSLSVLGSGRGLLTHRGPQDSICVYAAISTPEPDWATRMNFTGKSASEVKEVLLDEDTLFGKWDPQLKDLMATAFDEETKDNPGREADIAALQMLPLGAKWDHRVGVTLVGDAAHLMSPFAGEGVNLALWDVLDLATVLGSVPEVDSAAAWHAAVEPSLRQFEEHILERAREKADEAHTNQAMMMGKNGAEEMAKWMKMAFDMAAPGEMSGGK